MLITFSSKAHNDVTMFGDIAQSFIKMMGYTTEIPGAITAEDVNSALANLEKNLAVAAAADQQQIAQDKQQAVDDEDEKESEIKITVRAIPLIELLKAAISAKSYVMWQ
ncbi:hypothetical protein UB37_07490 [Photobacterium iliopiscarium]|jgi:hypothetical protein|uniref:DUF1840 domain-containing protein n=1 Tax=Photobacterium iliopiscarium TaxID=56192 RepID=A0ABX5GSH1_9GAMM|nr:DUF1840 domain-containing protein [Photobacterium iliopiscarium]KJG23068.1 hypothetical protein UB37_07490 [Photobacterium iliopiscarium]PSW96623.1 DUF1840 domain-containing protein [Photobacterium iliopiscarium]